MLLVNIEPLTAVQHTSDRRFTLTHPTEFPLHTVQGIPAETGYLQSQDSGPSCPSCATMERVCASFQQGPQKSALRCGFVYKIVWKMHFTPMFLPLSYQVRNRRFTL